MKVINSFRGDFNFLSNFFTDAPFVDEIGIYYPTSEHYYQAMKTMNMNHRNKIINAYTPREAKRFGNYADLRPDWNNVKVDVMKNAVRFKFDQWDKYRVLLIQTEDYELVEGNWWHDNYWGNCFCDKCENIEGKNMLGKILMNLRAKYVGL